MNKSSGYSPQRVCIVTSECVGPFKNGGIGTSMTGLAETLAHNGHEVVLLYTRGAYLTSAQVKRWQDVYRENRIDFRAIRPDRLRSYGGPLVSLGYLTPSYVVDFLSESAFDVVHFNDTDGEGFLAHALHRAGLLLPNATFQTNIHSPREWVGALNGESLMHPIDLAMRAAERFSIEHSDLICGPSQYLLDWIRDRGYSLPERVVQQQYVMPRDVVRRVSAIAQRKDSAPSSLQRIVFFGRLEERKGLRLFLHSISAVADRLAASGVSVTFLGRSVMIDGKTSRQFIADAAAGWPISYEIISDKGQQEALDYLASPGTLTVIASPADNSPCTVYECLLAEIPFVAANTGGIPELIAKEYHADTLFEPEVSSLSQTLLKRLKGQTLVPTPAVSQSQNETRWMDQHEAFRASHSTPTPVDFDLANLLVLVDATLGRQGEDKTLSSLTGIGLDAANIAVLKNGHDSAGQFATLDAWAMLKRLKDHAGPVLVLGAGFTIKSADVLQRVSQALLGSSADGFLCSVSGPGNIRIDHPGCGPAVSLCHGPSIGQCTLIANSLELAKTYKTEMSDTGPAFGLLDQATVKGASFWPLAFAVAEFDSSAVLAAHVPMTDNRLGLYSNLAPEHQAALLVQAAVGARINPKMLARNMVFRLATTRLGFLLPHISNLREKIGV